MKEPISIRIAFDTKCKQEFNSRRCLVHYSLLRQDGISTGVRIEYREDDPGRPVELKNLFTPYVSSGNK